MNSVFHQKNPSSFLNKLQRPYPIIPFCDPLRISPENMINSSQNAHISPLHKTIFPLLSIKAKKKTGF